MLNTFQSAKERGFLSGKHVFDTFTWQRLCCYNNEGIEITLGWKVLTKCSYFDANWQSNMTARDNASYLL